MARKISDHPEVAPGTVFDGTEVALFNKSGVTYKGTMAQILAYKADLNGAAFTGTISFADGATFNGPTTFTSTVTGLTKTMVGLDQVDNTADLDKPISSDTQIALDLKVPTSALAQPSGVATLGVDGKLLPAQMPAGIDAVQEYANLAAFPATGASNIIYLAADTSKSYRWGTTVYVEIVASPGTTDAVTEGTTNLYFTTARVRSTVLTGLSVATNAVVAATDTVLGAFGKLQAQISAHFGSGGTAHAVATTSVAGFLSAADKVKLDAISPGGGSASTLSGGTAGQVPYQSAPGTTSFSAGLLFDGTSALTLGPTSGNAIFRAAGPSSATANGGQVTISAGAGGATSGSGGAITLTSGTTSGSGSVGAITVKPGNGVAANSSPGLLTLSGGDSSGNAGGAVTLKGGNSSSGSFAGGAVNISGGTSAAGTAGAVVVSTAGTERFRVLANGAWSVGASGTATGNAGQVLTSGGNSAVPVWAIAHTTPATSLTGTAIDLSLGALFYKTISGATTLTLSNVPTTGTAVCFLLDLTNGGSAVITWWSGMKWAGGIAPTLTASGRDMLAFITHDGGTTWSGLVLGKDIK